MDDDREAAGEQRAVYAILAVAIGVLATGLVIGRAELDVRAVAILGAALIAIVGLVRRSRAPLPQARARR